MGHIMDISNSSLEYMNQSVSAKYVKVHPLITACCVHSGMAGSAMGALPSSDIRTMKTVPRT